MKRALVVAVALVFVSQFATPLAQAADVSVSRSMPSRVDPQATLTVSFTISPTETVSSFDLAELIPETWAINDWYVSGFDKNNIDLDTQESQAFMGSTYKGYHWKFNADFSSTVTLTYNLNVPVYSGNYGFVGIWTYSGGFSKDERTLTVGTASTTTVPPTTTTTTTTSTVPTILPPEIRIPPIGWIIVIAIVVIMFLLWKGIIKI